MNNACSITVVNMEEFLNLRERQVSCAVGVGNLISLLFPDFFLLPLVSSAPGFCVYRNGHNS